MSSDIWVAIIGGIVTILVGMITGIAGYKGAINGAILQIEKQNNDALSAKKDEEQISKRFIESFLYDEIKRNLNLVNPGVLEALKHQGEGKLKTGYILGGFIFSFETYEEIKFQLIKLSELIYIADIMTVYKSFRKLNLIREIHKMEPAEALELYNNLKKWIDKLDLEHFK
ncbi:hypothetical protein ABES21_24285 [Peribacillus frigoritolerans]|uniref:hypothetical protein n=1 Tax=Peribacillus frigoritolerans TaxID=450367 RepID=UPI003D2DCF83